MPVYGHEVAAIILDELSYAYGDVCNFLTAASYARRGEVYLALLAVEEQISGIEVASARQHWAFAQARAALKKLYDPLVDQWAETRRTWFSDERRCMRQNQKFEALHNRRLAGVKPVPFSKEDYRFYEALNRVLGDEPDLDAIAEASHYGPGSTISVRGREVHYARKVEAFECTPLGIDLAVEALLHDKAVWAHVGMDPVYSLNPDAQQGFRRVVRQLLLEHTTTCDRLMFIHKSITTMRSIGAQPTCSGMVQLGVHSVVSQLLVPAGIDLMDQSWNQRLAMIGSRDWEDVDPIATLDKSSASNLIARKLIQYRFPPAWAKLLQRIRSTHYEAPQEIGGGTYEYQMYAGMGNGTTFVVETLIFFAMAYATSEVDFDTFVRQRRFAVYGDDVALPRSHAIRYVKYAEHMGFRFNRTKTFLEGPFRESCGADYYAGVNVRPAYVKAKSGSVTLEQLDLIGIHNTLADNRHFPLPKACAKIRELWEKRMYPVVPTDPSGNLGFRPIGKYDYYHIVRDSQGRPILSDFWQRPRTYMVETRPKFADLGELDPWTEIAVALLRARQSDDFHQRGARWSLPYRDLVNCQVKAETDLVRKDLVQMITNQLSHLAKRKEAPWYESSRGNRGIG